MDFHNARNNPGTAPGIPLAGGVISPSAPPWVGLVVLLLILLFAVTNFALVLGWFCRLGTSRLIRYIAGELCDLFFPTFYREVWARPNGIDSKLKKFSGWVTGWPFVWCTFMSQTLAHFLGEEDYLGNGMLRWVLPRTAWVFTVLEIFVLCNLVFNGALAYHGLLTWDQAGLAEEAPFVVVTGHPGVGCPLCGNRFGNQEEQRMYT